MYFSFKNAKDLVKLL